MLTINPKIFKAYDIRGVYQKDFDDNLAYLLGLAYVKLRQNDPDYQINKKMTIAVAYDMRLSSPNLKIALIKGLKEAGVDVVDLGLISTPSFYFAVGHYNYSGGIMISASHNPKEWNGFKLVRSQAIPISKETGINFISKEILEKKLSPSKTLGKIYRNKKVLKDELKEDLKSVNLKKIKHFKIVVDTANGMGATYLKTLFSKLPVKLIPLNFKLDGSFPIHEANPSKEENLKELEKVVQKEKADLGITTDGDGDRIFFVDNTGKTINPAIIRGLLSKLFLEDKPHSKIGYDVRPGKITSDLIIENGGQAILTQVGHSLIKEQMLKENIYFAGESSGHFYLQGLAGCFEYPMIMILKLLVLFSTIPGNIADYIKQYEKYYSSGEINRKVDDKELIFKKIKEKYSQGKITELDGVSVNYPSFWFNVRASNTEPLIRLNLEAISPEIMAQKRDEVLSLIN